MKGLITKSTGLWYVVRANGQDYPARLKGKFKLTTQNLTNPLTVGDYVDIQRHAQVHDEWVIASIAPRTNYVLRQSPRKKGADHLIASNIDQGMLIATLKMPRTSTGFIDRFLVSLEAFRIPGVIVFNKSDLYQSKDHKKAEELKEMYEQIGYTVLITSFLEKDALPQLRSLLQPKTTLLAGHSGAGKSTLINALLPHAQQEVKAISNFANKGVHTTTFSEMFHFEDGHSKVIDTPGIKELGLAEIDSEELSHYFPEMRAYLGQCKFHNCLHDNEPGCAIKARVGQEIPELRYQSYCSMLHNEDNRR